MYPPPPPRGATVTLRAGFPGPGSAEPAALPSDSLRGAHADARWAAAAEGRGEERGEGELRGGGGGSSGGGRRPGQELLPPLTPLRRGGGPRRTRPQPGPGGWGSRAGRGVDGARHGVLGSLHWGCGSSRWRRRGPWRPRRPEAREDEPGPGGRAGDVAVGAGVSVTCSHPRGTHGDLATRTEEAPPPSSLDIVLLRWLAARHGSSGR